MDVFADPATAVVDTCKGTAMTRFKNDITLTACGDNRFDGTVTPNWSINGIPNGGYLMALMAKAMRDHGSCPCNAIVTANFLSRSQPGAARLAVEKIAASPQFDRFQCSLYQDGTERIRALGTFANQPCNGGFVRYESSAPHVAPRDRCLVMPAMPGYTLFEQVEVRMDPDSVGWMSGRLSAKSEHKGWIRFREGGDYDVPALLLIADAFPPPVFASQGMVAWVPSIELSVNIRNLPETEWLTCIFRTRFITGGFLEEDGQVWDETGRLIAVSRQIAQYRRIS
jgi:hypothetical protein